MVERTTESLRLNQDTCVKITLESSLPDDSAAYVTPCWPCTTDRLNMTARLPLFSAPKSPETGARRSSLSRGGSRKATRGDDRLHMFTYLNSIAANMHEQAVIDGDRDDLDRFM